MKNQAVREAGAPGPSSFPPSDAGKYRLFATLGEGGMAQVCLALARGPAGFNFNKLVVLKRMRAQLAQDRELVTMFLDEARLAARLSHPNVIDTYEVGDYEGSYFIAMEYLEGQPLNRVLAEARHRAVPVGRGVSARIVADALAGLHYAHELADFDGRPLHIIHRDVSPHNVFITYDGQVKLVDFGVAKAALSLATTQVGVLKGKIAYMSPEQASGESVDRRSDVYAMGIVLWEAMTGKRLYGDGPAATLYKLMNVDAPKLTSVGLDVDPEIEHVVAKALERRPADRFQSALEMRNALEAWMQRRGESARQDEIGRLVLELFEEERDTVKRQIQEYTTALVNDPEAAQRLSENLRSPLEEGALPALDIKVTDESGNTIRADFGTAAPPRKSKRGLVLAVCLAAAVVGVVLLLALRHTGARVPAAGGDTAAAPPSVPLALPAPPATGAATSVNAAAAAQPAAPPPSSAAPPQLAPVSPPARSPLLSSPASQPSPPHHSAPVSAAPAAPALSPPAPPAPVLAAPPPPTLPGLLPAPSARTARPLDTASPY